jgi:hypothetical protein
MNALRNIHNSQTSEPANTIQELNKVDDHADRISISISRKAYDALVKHTKQLNEENPEYKEPFSIEEVLDEEIILLFDDGWKEK